MSATPNQVNGKDAIVNGSLNKFLTVEDMCMFPLETKKTILWYIICRLPEKFARVDYAGIQSMNDYVINFNIDGYFTKLVNAEKERQQIKNEKDFLQGKEIRKVQGELGFSGKLEMSFYKMLGYITQGGSWNDFYPDKIIPVLKQLEETCPKRDYGVNNPNTGRDDHKWSVSDDTICISIPYTRDSQEEKWNDWFKKVEHLRYSAKMDSFKYCAEAIDDDAYTIEVRMYWD